MIAELKLLFTDYRRRRTAMRAFAEFRAFAPTTPWTDDEKQALDDLLRTPIGVKLMQMLCAEISQQDFSASINAGRHEHAAGWACGFRACVQAINDLRPPPPNGDNTEEGKFKGDPSLDHLHP
jgi:hypothetical protein